MKLLFHCYRLVDPGLLLIWRIDEASEQAGELWFARSATLHPHSLVAVLPPRRRWALVADPVGDIATLYWRADNERTGRVKFCRCAPDEAITAEWRKCGLLFRGEDAEAWPELPPDAEQHDGLRAAWRDVEGGGQETLEWTNASLLRPPSGIPALDVTMTFRPGGAASTKKRSAEPRMGDLTIEIKANGCLRHPIRVWVDRLNAQDTTPEAAVAYRWKGTSWSEQRAREWQVWPPDGEVHLKIPRLPEKETHGRPARFAVDERDIFVVRAWPDISVRHLLCTPDQTEVEAVEYRAGDLVAPDSERQTMMRVSEHWQTRYVELSAGREAPPEAWRDLPEESRAFLAEYRHWLEELSPELLRSFLCSEEIFPGLLHLPTPFGSMVVHEALGTSRLLADASGTADEGIRSLAFFGNPGFFHAAWDSPAMAGMLAKRKPTSQTLANFTIPAFLFERLAADERLVAEIPRVSAAICCHYLLALDQKAPRDAVIDLLLARFQPEGASDVMTAGPALKEFLNATDLGEHASFSDATAALGSELAALRKYLTAGAPTLLDLRRLADSAKELRGRLDLLLAEERRQQRRVAIRVAIMDFLCKLLPLPNTNNGDDDLATALAALPAALSSARRAPILNDGLREQVARCEEELRSQVSEWRAQEQESQPSGGDIDIMAALLLEVERSLPLIAPWEAARRTKGDLRFELDAYERQQSSFGPVARTRLEALAEQLRAHLSESPPPVVALPGLRDAFAEMLARETAREQEAHEAASVLAKEADCAFPDLSIPAFEDSEQYAPVLQTMGASFNSRLRERESALHDRANQLRRLAETAELPVELPLTNGANDAELPGANDDVAELARYLAARIKALLAGEHGVGAALENVVGELRTRFAKDPRWTNSPVLNAVESGNLTEAANILRCGPALERYEAAHEKLRKLVAPDQSHLDLLILLRLVPPLLAQDNGEGMDGARYGRCCELLAGDVEAAVPLVGLPAERLVSLSCDLDTLIEDIRNRDGRGQEAFRGCILSAFRLRCERANEALAAFGNLPAAQALLSVPPKNWNPNQLNQAEQLLTLSPSSPHADILPA